VRQDILCLIHNLIPPSSHFLCSWNKLLRQSLGEAFDKTARLLGLPVGGGGGPAVEALAKEGDPKSVVLPIPLRHRKEGFDFSYAGLKTAVRMVAEKMERGTNSTQNVEDNKPKGVVDLSHQDKANVAASFQNIAICHIEDRLVRAMAACELEGITTLAVVGGVAANQELRSRLELICNKRQWTLQIPPPRLCTDQGAMSAWAAIERIFVGSTDDPFVQEVYARYPFGEPTLIR
jgi:N6-L-threonylcarbamoyladenine synthase